MAARVHVLSTHARLAAWVPGYARDFHARLPFPADPRPQSYMYMNVYMNIQ